MEMNDPFDISIPGLNEKQMYLLDCIWACRTQEEFVEWFAMLPEQDRDQVQSLQHMVLLAYIDNMAERSALLEAQQVLSKFTGGNKDVA